MATLQIINLTNTVLPIQGGYITVGPNASRTIVRNLPDVEMMPELLTLYQAGQIDLAVTVSPEELAWRQFMQAVDGGHAMGNTTAVIHKPTITLGDAEPQPGAGPAPIVFGTIMGLHYDNITDAAFRLIKIDTSFVSDELGPGGSDSGANASFHVHWTKSSAGDESGSTVRWILSYTVFDGATEEIANGVTPTVLTFDDTYVDNNTGDSRVAYRTVNVPAPGLRPGYYVGVKLEYDDGNTTLTGGPVVISTDLLFRNRINR